MCLTDWLRNWRRIHTSKQENGRSSQRTGSSRPPDTSLHEMRRVSANRQLTTGSRLLPKPDSSLRRTPRVPLVERLEERIVLTTPVGNTLADAMPLSLITGSPWSISAGIGDETPNSYYAPDVDIFSFDLAAGQTIYGDVDAQETSSGVPLSGLDGYLRIFDSSGTELANNDNSLGADPFLSYSASVQGTYYLGVSGAPNRTYDPHSTGTYAMSSTGNYDLRLTVSTSSGTGSSGSTGGGTTGGGSTGGGTTGGGSTGGGTSGGGTTGGGTTGGGSTGGGSSGGGSSPPTGPTSYGPPPPPPPQVLKPGQSTSWILSPTLPWSH